MKRFFSITLMILCFASFANGQSAETPTAAHVSTVGFELDALPYVTGGYYGSIWYGIKQFRFRGVIAKIKPPGFLLDEGYENNEVKAYALIVDYFFKDNFEGFWGGVGLEYWDSSIEHENETVTAKYNNTIFTVGGGYVWKFYKNFYLNPWVAVHAIIAGEKDVRVGSRTYEPQVVTPEASVKIGWHF